MMKRTVRLRERDSLQDKHEEIDRSVVHTRPQS